MMNTFSVYVEVKLLALVFIFLSSAQCHKLPSEVKRKQKVELPSPNNDTTDKSSPKIKRHDLFSNPRLSSYFNYFPYNYPNSNILYNYPLTKAVLPSRDYLPPIEDEHHFYPTIYPEPSLEPTWASTDIEHYPTVEIPTPIFELPEVIDARAQTQNTKWPSNAKEVKYSSWFSKDTSFTSDQHHNLKEDKGSVYAEVIEMNCDKDDGGLFKAILNIKTDGAVNDPVLEDSDDADLNSTPCTTAMERADRQSGGATLRINLASSVFLRCGVKSCSPDKTVEILCVRLRFPTITNLRLPEDPILTLQCRKRSPVVAHTKHLYLPVNNDGMSRRSGSVATGGSSNNLQTSLLVFKKEGLTGDFRSLLSPGDTVLLGEEILLKVEVLANEGWHFSRLSDMTLSGAESRTRGVALVDTDGCVEPAMRAVCPEQPRQLSATSHTVIIRMPLFRGMHNGGRMKLSVRVIACTREQDCIAPTCTNSRNKRNVIFNRSNEIFKDSQNKFTVSVAAHEDTTDTSADFTFNVVLQDENARKSMLSSSLSLGVITFLVLTVCLLFIYIRRRKDI